MASGIYKITDKRNNKIYIGRAVNLQNRKWRHYCYTHPEDYLESSLLSEISMEIHKAMMESRNKNDFIFEVVEECSEEKLNEREQYYIKYYDCIIPKGYNKTKGGNSFPHLSGEKHPNHKITLEEANKIKFMLKNKKTVEDIIKEIPKATMGIISHINTGRTWKEPNITYPISRLNGLIKFDDELVMEIRRKREEGKTATELSKEYNTSVSTITSICNGNTHKDLPILRTNIIKNNHFSEEEVEFFRQQYYINNISIKELYNNSNFKNKITYDGFKSMVNGTSYKQYKIYDKQIKKDNLINRNNKIREMASKGMDKKEIAKIIGCSERTIYRAINKENKFE